MEIRNRRCRPLLPTHLCLLEEAVDGGVVDVDALVGELATNIGSLVRLDYDRTFLGDRVGRSSQQRTLRQVTVPAGWRERRMVGRGAGSHACCGVRSGSLSRLAGRVAGDAVRRGQLHAERRMKARTITSSATPRT
jgi:hypothetical protein